MKDPAVVVLVWFSAAFLALLMPVVVALYWKRELAVRRKEIIDCIKKFGIDQFYIKDGDAGADGSAVAAVDAYFNSRFSVKDYIGPASLLFCISAVAFSGAAVWLLRQLDDPSVCGFAHFLANSSPVLPAFLGAYVFCLQETVYRYMRFDLLPSTVLNMTFTLVAGTFLGVVLSPLFVFRDAALLPTFSAAVGLSVPVALEAVKERLVKKLGFRRVMRNESDLAVLFPSNRRVVARLAEEGVESFSDLAQSDPIKLFLILPFEFPVILNWIDKALLHAYFPSKTGVLRDEFQITCMSEFVCIVKLFGGNKDAGDGTVITGGQAQSLVDKIAKALDVETEAVRNSLDTFNTDPQICRVWDMYGAFFDG